MRKKLAAAAAMAAIALPITGATAAAAAPATESAATTVSAPAELRYPCGFHATLYSVWYNHCGPTTVMVYVDMVRGDDYVYCLPPGNTYLGPEGSISNAWYIGGAGCSPVTKP